MAVAGDPIIVKEGWIYLVVSAMAALAAHHYLGWVYGLPLWALVIALMFLFRDPQREIPAIPLAVVSPADGQVLSVTECTDPYLKRPAHCVSISMNPWGIYTMRSPMEGKVQQRWHTPPELEADTDQSPRYGIWIETDEGDDIVLVMLRPSVWKSPQCYVHSGERVGQGQRCGFIRFGSRVDLYLPVTARVSVGAGDRVRAGSDVIATLLRK